MKVRNRNFKKVVESPNFWPSFTDVMSTIVLVLFFLIFLAYFQQIISSSIWNQRLDEAKVSLDIAKAELADAEEQLEKRKIEISEREKLLHFLAQQSDDLRAEVEQGKKELALSMDQLNDKAIIIANSNQELESLRSKLQNISVLRLSILQKVKESIEGEIGKTSSDSGEELVKIGDNANLVINESLLFKFGSADISGDGKSVLTKFSNAFEKILDDPSLIDSIDSISIEGHADIIGESEENRILSCKRAANVIQYMMAVNPNLEKKYAYYFAATGFSEFRPIDLGLTEASREKNRRIEISINIKDSHVQQVIQEYLDDAKEGMSN